ncbi:Uu.00g001540.m01.CDS01 [Anthostomella pinea]|uniref:Uu.00g001540.m01.CDS01 n=1 Tax=Anthostomella pinea TaxID=933095 RepID=A0AAI8VKI8_9PEZI|nr:Uu.00g001540.m01.CDS01 [Anthostomella pinea]
MDRQYDPRQPSFREKKTLTTPTRDGLQEKPWSLSKLFPSRYSPARGIELRDMAKGKELAIAGLHHDADEETRGSSPFDVIAKREKGIDPNPDYATHYYATHHERGRRPKQRPVAPHYTANRDSASVLDAIRDVDVILDSAQCKDQTVHLDLDADIDLDMDLEELARFSRLGKFGDAISLYQRNLRVHIGNPHVLIQYGEMLLEQGDYKTLLELDCDLMGGSTNSLLDTNGGQLLDLYWRLIQGSQDRTRSTEIRILSLVAYWVRETPLTQDGLDFNQQFKTLFPQQFFTSLYISLLRQGRIWDLHDIIGAMVYTRDINAVLSDLLGAMDFARGLDQLINDWQAPVYDESTTLALLGIINLFLEFVGTFNAPMSTIQYCLDSALSLARSINQHDLENLRSRQYVKFIFLKAARTAAQHEHVLNPSVYLFSANGFRLPAFKHSTFLPVYIPIATENPGWRKTASSTVLTNPIKLALRSSTELRDYKMAALCWQQLINLSSDPKSEFEALCHLKKSVQADMAGYLEVLLSSYLVSDTDEARRKLRTELAEVTSSTITFSFLNAWAAHMMLHSLETDPDRAARAISQAVNIFPLLPPPARDQVSDSLPFWRARYQSRPHGQFETTRMTASGQLQIDAEDQIEADQLLLDARRTRLHTNRQKAEPKPLKQGRQSVSRLQGSNKASARLARDSSGDQSGVGESSQAEPDKAKHQKSLHRSEDRHEGGGHNKVRSPALGATRGPASTDFHPAAQAAQSAQATSPRSYHGALLSSEYDSDSSGGEDDDWTDSYAEITNDGYSEIPQPSPNSLRSPITKAYGVRHVLQDRLARAASNHDYEDAALIRVVIEEHNLALEQKQHEADTHNDALGVKARRRFRLGTRRYESVDSRLRNAEEYQQDMNRGLIHDSRIGIPSSVQGSEDESVYPYPYPYPRDPYPKTRIRIRHTKPDSASDHEVAGQLANRLEEANAKATADKKNPDRRKEMNGDDTGKKEVVIGSDEEPMPVVTRDSDSVPNSSVTVTRYEDGRGRSFGAEDSRHKTHTTGRDTSRKREGWSRHVSGESSNSIEPVSRRSTMPTVENVVDFEGSYSATERKKDVSGGP